MDPNPDVLVVDDCDADAELSALVIRKSFPGTHVFRLKDGEQALQFLFRSDMYARRPPGMPRLVLLDVEMPKVSGFEVLAAIRSHGETSAIPVVMFSAIHNPLAIEHSYLLGVSEYVIKPADFSEYRMRLECILRYWLRSNAGLATPATSPSDVSERATRSSVSG